MSPQVETFVRSLLVVVTFAILSFLANSANLTPLFGVGASGVIAALAGMLDKYFSPNGTVVVGSFGTPTK